MIPTRLNIVIILTLAYWQSNCTAAQNSYQDLVYGSHELQKGDLTLPSGNAATIYGEPFPLVITIHGGGWSQGDKSLFIRHANFFNANGFATFNINYRLRPEASMYEIVQDVCCATAWAAQHLAPYKVNVNRIALYGNSAGAHLVAFLGTAGLPTNNPNLGVWFGDCSSYIDVQGFWPEQFLVYAMATPCNLLKMNDFAFSSLPVDTLMYQRVSPSYQIGAHTQSSFILAHGDADNTVPYKQAQDFVSDLQDQGIEAEFILIPGGNHGTPSGEMIDGDLGPHIIQHIQQHWNLLPVNNTNWQSVKKLK